MNNIVTPILRDFNPPYIGRGLIVLWFILDHDLDCTIDIRKGILTVHWSSIPHADGLIAFCTERDIDKNDNAKLTYVLKNFGINGITIDLKLYGYEAPDLPYDKDEVMTDPSYWYRKSSYFKTTQLYPDTIDGTVYGQNMPSFKYLYNYIPGRNILGADNYDIGIRSIHPNGVLKLVGVHHGCDYTCWGGFGMVINFDIARYRRELKLGIV